MARPIQDSVVLFGDSITSRQDVPRSLHARFSDAYRRTLDVQNRGYGGYNTTMGFPIMDQFLAHKDEAHLYSRIRLMTVWFGTNDAAPPHLPLRQHVPVREYTENLHKILDTLTSNEKYPAIPNIILITPPPMHQPGIHPDEPIRRDWEVTKTYVDAAKKVGEEWRAKAGKGQADWRIATVSAWDAVIEAAGGTGDQLAPFFTDGLHLSTRGYDAVWAKISDIVKNDFRGRGVDWDDAQNLPLTLPDWGLLDKSSPDNVVKGMKGGYRRESSA